MRNIVVLTGAGVSAESGVATFRGPDGLWEGHRVEDVATPHAFERDPALVHAFYDARRAKLGTVEPNGAHAALARLDAEWPGELLIVTQNVDDLHERAGTKRLLHMHGELKKGWCLACGERFPWDGPMGENSLNAVRPEPVEGLSFFSNEQRKSSPSTMTKTDHPPDGPGLSSSGRTDVRGTSVRTSSGRTEVGICEAVNICPSCNAVGRVRPDIVWFGEMPYAMERIDEALMRCDLFVSIGTSGAVYPAAGFVQTARYCGAHCVEINLEPSLGSYFFHESRTGKAGELVPQWVDEVLAA